MKLSEAIRLGSLLRPQCYGTPFDEIGSCAFGAAREAIGMVEIGLPVLLIWNWLTKPQTCPECFMEERIGGAVVSVHLNDRHHWTRERIADWVATVEPEELPSVVTEETPEALKAAQ